MYLLAKISKKDQNENKDFLRSEMLGLSKLVMEVIEKKRGKGYEDEKDLIKQAKVLLKKVKDFFWEARLSLLN